MGKLKLHYFGIMGRAEISRMMMAEGKMVFEDHRVDNKEWAAMKADMPFEQMPVLEIDNWKLAETGAIERYIARKCNLYGTTVEEQAQIDMVVEGCKDVIENWVRTNFHSKDTEKADKIKAFYADEVPKWAKFQNNLLKKNDGGKGYFVGKTCTYADIAVFRAFSFFAIGNPDAMKNTPELKAMCDRVAARPQIAEYLKKRPVTEF